MIEPIYCFEVNFKTTINNKGVTGFAISNSSFDKTLYGVNKTFIIDDLKNNYKVMDLYRYDYKELIPIRLDFSRVLVYYYHFVEAVRISNLSKPKYILDPDYSYIEHCQYYKDYYEKLVEVIQLVIAKWDDW